MRDLNARLERDVQDRRMHIIEMETRLRLFREDFYQLAGVAESSRLTF